MLQLFVKWEDYFLIVLWIQSVSSWKLIHSVQSALQNKLCLPANSAVAVTKRLMSLQNKLRCSNFSVRHQQISVDFWFPWTQYLKKKKKKLSQILSSIHICDITMKLKGSKRMEKGIFWSWWESSCQTSAAMVYQKKYVCLEEYLKPIAALTFPAYKITRLN